MKPNTFLALLITILSIISGYLVSKASLVGKVGMSLFYREYNFLKTWWKGAILMWLMLSLLCFAQGWLQKRFIEQNGRTVHIVALALSLTGLCFSYNDFRHTLSHRWLGERFHLGVYLFWLGWSAISIFYLWQVAAGETAGDGPPLSRDRKSG